MEIFGIKDNYILDAAIPVTILVIIISLSYTMRNVLRIWNAGKPVRDTDKQGNAQNEANNSDQESAEESNDEETKEKQEPEIDPVQYCEHIQSQVKKARQRVAAKEIQQNLTAEELENEREIQRKQIEDIFKLMEQNSDKFGETSEEDMVQQMRLYV
ncbi:hypothetical protein ACF0H5_000866 [Mactra antiquata]